MLNSKLARFFSIILFSSSISVAFAADSVMSSSPGPSDYRLLSNPKIMQLQSTPISQPVLKENFASLPVCPTNVDCTAPTANCPDQCRVTRTPEVPAVDQSGFVTNAADSRAAICPAGYAMVGSYNVQKELRYQSNPPTVYPIIGYQTYLNYKNASYSCVPRAPDTLSKGYCISNDPKFYVGQIIDNLIGLNGKVVRITNVYNTKAQAYDGCTCKGSCATCSCKVASDPRTTYGYMDIQCTPPAGLFVTGEMVPASAVCAKSAPTWKQVN